MVGSSEEFIASIYRHDVSNINQILAEASNPESDYDPFDLAEDERQEIMSLAGTIDGATERLSAVDDLGFAAAEISELAGYMGEFEGELGEKVDEVADLSQLAESFVVQGVYKKDLTVQDVMFPLESRGEVTYGVDPSSDVYGDPGLCLVANTLARNALLHGGPETGLFADVMEEEGFYRIDVWDDGEGLQGYDPEEIFEQKKGDNTGRGLYLAKQITENFDGDITYSEENAEREDGFGLEWYLRPAQYSTSESE